MDEMALEVKGIFKRYGRFDAVNGLDLTIPKGEFYSLLGKNGAGKTTTIKILSCLERPTSGIVRIFAVDATKHASAIRGRMAVSPQETAVAKRLNARENLELMAGLYGMAAKEIPGRVEELLETFGLAKRSAEPVLQYSGGMQRKLSIAMALVARPEILFLDEPTLGLDPESRKNVWELIRALKGSTTILLTTHYLEEADALSDRIGVLDRGRMIAEGSPSVLKDQYGGATGFMVKGSYSDSVVEKFRSRFGAAEPLADGVLVLAGQGGFDDIAAFARDIGLKVDGIHLREPSLDDVFLALAGKRGEK